VLVCGVGLAQPIERGSLRMVWKAPPECPTDLETLARIEALLGVRVSEMPMVPFAARGRVTRVGPAHYELSLETFQGEQRFLRTMQAASCTELTDAGALVLALAIDPTLIERRAGAAHTAGAVSPEPAPSTSAPAPPQPKRPPRRAPTARSHQPEPEPEPEPRRSARFLLGARVVADFGSIADLAFGPGIGVAVQWKALEVSLDGVWLPQRRALVEPGKGGDISLVAAGLRGCYRPFTGTLEALGCASFELGSLDGEGVGTVVRTHESGLWTAPGAHLSGRLRLGSRVLLSLGAGAVVPIQPIDFTLFNVGVVHEVPPLVARAEAGIQAHFD
jgi:hypothetical protein